MPEAIIYTFVFLLGASIGSFLNVCIHRIPLRISVCSPSSTCPLCHNPVRFYDNIPILSYIILWGRCRDCKAHISAQYPIVEALGASFAVSLYVRFGLAPEFIIFFLFIASLMVVSFIDLRLKIIPDIVSLPGIAAGFILSFILYDPPLYALMNSLSGILLGAGVLLAIAAGYHWATGSEGMGGGDIKLLSMVGAFLGWKGVFFTLFAGSFVGAIIGGGLMLFFGKESKYAIPFGPFLSIGAVLYVFFGSELINWYIMNVWAA